MLTMFIEGFLLGIAMGTTCIASCGPIYAPYLMQYGKSLRKSFFAVLELSIGRFISYGIVGAAAGHLGRQAEFTGKGLLTAVAYVLFSIFLLITVFRTHRHDHLCRAGRWAAIIDRPLVLGMLTGINICPPFLLALTKAMCGSVPIAGITLFAAFFIGTSIFLIPLSVFGMLGDQRLFRSVARCAAVAISCWFMILAGGLIYNHYWNIVMAPEKKYLDIVFILPPLHYLELGKFPRPLFFITEIGGGSWVSTKNSCLFCIPR